jgi:hypothetical protein
VHRYTLEPLTDDATKVTVEESMAGPLLAVVGFTQAKMIGLMQTCLETLKAASEAGS